MSRRLVLLLAVVVVGAVAWFVVTRPDRPAEAPVAEGDGEARPAPTALAPSPRVGPASSGRTAEGGGTVEGIVVRDGRPTAARVEVRFGYAPRGFFAGHTAERTLAESIGFAPRPRVLRTANAGDDGRFALHGVPPGQFDVLAVASDGARGFAQVHVAADGARARVTVVVRPTTSLVGRARTVAGAPFVGRVAVTPATAASGPREDDAVALDADGGFTVAGLMPGFHFARFVTRDGTLWFRPTPLLPLTGTWEVVVDQGAGTLEGRVVDDATGAGVGGARVVASGTDGSSSVSAATDTGADGAFVVPDLVGGTPFLVVGAEGYAASSVTNVVERPVVIRLARAATLRGTVTRRRDGRPVEGAEVRALGIGTWSRGTPFGPVFTDPAGRYELGGLPPIELAVSAAAPGLAMPLGPADGTGWTSTSAALEAGMTTVVDVALDDAPVVHGRVLDADGRSVAHAVVTVAPIDESLWRDLAFPERGDVTGDDGAFELDGLPKGATVCLQVTTSVDPEGFTNSFVVAEGGPIIEIRVPTARALRVVVTRSHDGAPLPGAHVESLDGAVQASADAHGVAWIAPFRRVRSTTLRVRSPGYATAVVSVDPEAREVAASLGDGARLAGHVRDQVGEPVVGATVMAFGVDGPVGDVRSGLDGSFAFDDVADVDYQVQARHEEGSPSLVSAKARPGTPCVLTMTRRAPTTLAGSPPPADGHDVVITAVGPDGRPVHEAVLRAWSKGKLLMTDRIWSRIGRVRDPGTDGGRVEVSNPRDEFGRPLPYALGSATFGPDATRLEVRLTAGRAASGRVVGPDGAPLAGIVVTVERPHTADVHTDQPTETLADARTDRDGRFRFAALPEDERLRVKARPPVPWITPAPAAIRAGDTDVVLRLRVGVVPTLTVLAPDGTPANNVRVLLFALPSHREVPLNPFTTDERGQIRLPPLDPDRTFELTVRGNSGTPTVPSTRNPWRPADETLRLQTGIQVVIHVRDTAGRAIGATVRYRPSSGSWWAVTAANGDLTLPPQPAGPLPLRISADGYVPTDVVIDVSPTLAPTTVTLAAGHDLVLRVEGPPPQPNSLVVFSGPTYGATSGSADREADGSFRFRGLDPARVYTVWGPPVEDSDVYVLETLRGFGPEPVAVNARVGGRIRVRVRAPELTEVVEVRASVFGWTLAGPLGSDGEFVLRGVPPGRFTVSATARELDHDLESRAEVTAQAGDVLDLVLPPFE